MMYKKVSSNLLVGVSIVVATVLFSGCVKTYKVVTSETPQADEHFCYDGVKAQYLRSLTLYHQFATAAAFDALWLSPQMREAYVKLQSDCLGKDESTYKVLLRRQLEETMHWNAFYVLTDIRNPDHDLLLEQHSYWNLFIKTPQGEKIAPLSVKAVDLEPEIEALFGTKYTKHKSAYLIKFPSQKKNGEYYTMDKPGFSLIFTSPRLKGSMSWASSDAALIQKKDTTSRYIKVKTPYKKIVKDEDFYWS